MNLANALDAGCGVGFFAQALEECGLYVRGFDGRLENVVEARRRFPRFPFGQADIEDPDIARLGTFDLVLCFGLVYHLENPMLGGGNRNDVAVGAFAGGSELDGHSVVSK
jgi:2-polyprenyl-3-methyl-5-hydroxy-6-metoxy-1,4-benzoquinol methylase